MSVPKPKIETTLNCIVKLTLIYLCCNIRKFYSKAINQISVAKENPLISSSIMFNIKHMFHYNVLTVKII